MLTIRYCWKGKCPKHPLYDPAKHGADAIKGGCSRCQMLFAVYHAHRETLAAATVFDEVEKAGQVVSYIRSALADNPLAKRIRRDNKILRAGRREGEKVARDLLKA
jgi:hypothetical protein